MTIATEEMLTLKDVKSVLGISYALLIAHIREGTLKAHKVTGDPISRDEVGEDTYGLRIKPSDLQEYLKRTLVK